MQQLKQNKVAFLGMGLMGQRMSRRLLNAQIELAVWNRSPAACEELYTLGAKPLELSSIQDYPIIFICLADDAAVTAVFEKIKPFLKAKQIIVDFSSLSVDCTQTLAEQAKILGITWIDSPVSGGTQGAEQGNLVIFAGGDVQTIKQLSPLYDVLAQRVTRMGEVGAGQATKICNQLIVAANSTLIAEAVALARSAGVDASLLAPALADGFADSKPFQFLSPRMANYVFEPVQWKVQTLSKDLTNAMKLAQQNGLSLPVATRALQQLSEHQNQGFAEADLASFIQHIEA